MSVMFCYVVQERNIRSSFILLAHDIPKSVQKLCIFLKNLKNNFFTKRHDKFQ